MSTVTTIIDVRADILKYAGELERHSHEDLCCRMMLWAQVIRQHGIPLIRASKNKVEQQADNSNCMKVLCGCGDVIELNGTRDYKYEGGKYYCVDCMRS